jgi:hypothetical protein
LAGKHSDFFPSVKDIKSVEVWAEIGVIILSLVLLIEGTSITGHPNYYNGFDGLLAGNGWVGVKWILSSRGNSPFLVNDNNFKKHLMN